jgi:hypothetical protein
MLRVSPSSIAGGLGCFFKLHLSKHLRLATDRYWWQDYGTDIHRGIEHYLLKGEEPNKSCLSPLAKGHYGVKELRIALQLVKPVLPESPWPYTEVELWVNRPKNKLLGAELNHKVEFAHWVNRKDFAVHLYTDLWPDIDSMDTVDWKVRADLSFRRTPVPDLRDDPQAVMYQLFRSFALTGTWEEPGTMIWYVIDRKRWVLDKVSYTYGRGEALERWKLVLEPAVDLMLEIFGSTPKNADHDSIPDNGYYLDDQSGGRECDKWMGCPFKRRCMARGTPIFGAFSKFLQNHSARKLKQQKRRKTFE